MREIELQGAGAAAGCHCCVRLGAWVLVPQQYRSRVLLRHVFWPCALQCALRSAAGYPQIFLLSGVYPGTYFFNICFMVVRLQTFGCPHRRLVIFDDPSEAPITGMAQWLSHRAALHLGEDMTETR